MLNNLGWEEILLLAVLGLIIFGPDRLPKAAKDLGRLLRELRVMARGAASDLRAELGPEMADIDLKSLNPRQFVKDAMFGDDDVPKPTAAAQPPAASRVEGNERPPFDLDAT